MEEQGKATEEDPCHPNKWIIHTFKNSITYTQNTHIYTLHSIHDIHISTRTCHIHHKRGVTEVCYFGHFWLSYGRSAMSGRESHLVHRIKYCMRSMLLQAL